MAYKYPDQLGYINNKKGFASITSGGTTVSYVLTTRNCDTGKQLVIKTFTGNNNGMIESQTFVPQLPYRFILNDSYFFNNIKYSLYPFINIISLYNPGIHAVGKTITMPTIFNNGTSKFIEINLPRSCIGQMKGYYNYQKLSAYDYVDVNVGSVEAYDLEASMVVESVDSTHDNLIITVNSRVDLGLTYTSREPNAVYNQTKWYYTVPVTVLIKIDRSTLVTTSVKSQDVIPFSWTYPIDYRQDSYSVGIINSGIAGNYWTQLWNYNVIPGKYYTSADGRTNYRYAANSFGCLTDTAYDGASGYVTTTSLGNYSPGQKGFKQTHSVSIGSLTISGFNLPLMTNSNYKTNEMASKNAIVTSGNYYITSQDTYNNSSRNSNIMILDSELNVLAQLQTGSNINYTDLVDRYGVIYLTFCVGTKQYIFKFPNLTAGILGDLRKDRVLSGEGLKNLLVANGFTLISTLDIPNPPSTTVAYNLKDPVGKELKYFLDNSRQDKSVNADLSANFNGEDYNLRTISSAYVVMDKLNNYKTGQINSFQYIKV